MELALFGLIGLILSWLAVMAIFSSKPQARLARGFLASAGVVAGAWIATAGADMAAPGEVSLLVSLLRGLG